MKLILSLLILIAVYGIAGLNPLIAIVILCTGIGFLAGSTVAKV